MPSKEWGQRSLLPHGKLAIGMAAWVCLGDMPFIEVSTYRRIAEKITAEFHCYSPTFNSKMGNPAAFGKTFFTDLGALTGDSGGRKLTSIYPQAVRETASL